MRQEKLPLHRRPLHPSNCYERRPPDSRNQIGKLWKKYNLTELSENPEEILHQIGHSLKFYLNNKEVDLNRVSTLILQDVRKLGFGKISFDLLEDFDHE